VLDPSLAAATQQRKEADSSAASASEDDEEIIVKKRTTKKRGPTTAPKGLAATCNKLTQVLEGVQAFIAGRNVTDAIILDLTSSCLGILFLEPLASIHAALNSLQLTALNVARTVRPQYHPLIAVYAPTHLLYFAPLSLVSYYRPLATTH
jgi:hypothetical protein